MSDAVTFEQKHLVAPNVSTVPLYSPFRYPGGKSRLYPFMSKWLKSKASAPSILIEPFAGGAHIGLAAAIENMVDQVVLVEIDKDVAAVWNTILSHDYEWLVNRIANFDMTKESVDCTLNCESASTKEHAFAVILRNRISRGGITAPGSGKLNHGENGKGLNSRWYPDTLGKRIATIFKARDRIKFIEGDGLAIMRQKGELENAVFFIDPPYPKAGKRLYRHSDVDPREVFKVACSLKGDFLITYDDSEEIIDLVIKSELDVESIVMSTSHHRKKCDLLIGRDLEWL